MDTKNEISNRFIEAYNTLLSTGKVSDKKDFATKLGISASMITEIVKGRSSVGITAIQNIVFVFNISAKWLLTGEGEPYEKAEDTVTNITQTSSLEPTDTFLLLIREKDIIIRQQAEEIGRLKERIAQLEHIREKAVSDAPVSGIADVG